MCGTMVEWLLLGEIYEIRRNCSRYVSSVMNLE
jgi:hypothetical protein